MTEKKKTFFITALIFFLVGGVVGFWLSPHFRSADNGHYDLSSDRFNDVPAINESESHILLDPYLEVTEDNVHRVLQAFFAAPTIFYFSFSGEDERTDFM